MNFQFKKKVGETLRAHLKNGITIKEYFGVVKQLIQQIIRVRELGSQVILDLDSIGIMDGVIKIETVKSDQIPEIQLIKQFIKTVTFKTVFVQGANCEEVTEFLRFMDNQECCKTVEDIHAYCLKNSDDPQGETSIPAFHTENAAEPESPANGETGVLDPKFWEQMRSSKNSLETAGKNFIGDKTNTQIEMSYVGETGVLDPKFMNGGYAVPMEQGYAQPANGGFGQSLSQGYDQSMNGGYVAPMEQGYAQPSNGGFGQSLSQGYDQSMNGSYVQPRDGGFGQSFSQGYDQSMNGGYVQPMNQGYGQPMNGDYFQSIGGYGQSIGQGYCQPMGGGYCQPMNQGYQPQMNMMEENNMQDDSDYGETKVLDKSFLDQLDKEARYKEQKKMETLVASLVHLKNGVITYITGHYFTIGKENVDMVIDHPTVSRKHAVIVRKGNQFFISDNGSTNKTFVENQEIPVKTSVEIFNGNKIKFANEEYTFVTEKI